VATVVFVTLFLPFGFGNPHAARLVGKLGQTPKPGQPAWTVQLALTPRLQSGLRSLFEDADDLGLLSVEDSALVFRGDSVQLTVPFSQIQEVRRRNIGLRGLFVYGSRTVVSVGGLPNVMRLEFAERASLWLPGSRRASEQLFQSLSKLVHRG
jgi:hypothetical protein